MTAIDAVASEGPTAEAARDALTRGNAVDAVVAAVLVAAVASPSVLLGPVQMLVGGAGAGLLAIDGRVRQPGRGVSRPRGFVPDEVIPDAARVAVPLLPSALASALGSAGTTTLHRAAGASLAWAKLHAPDRVRIAEALTRLGPAALAEGAVAEELLAVGGRASRGLLTPKDLVASRPAIHRVDTDRLGASGIVRPPWASPHARAKRENGLGTPSGAHEEPPPSHSTSVVAAADARGLFAIACYEGSLAGVPVASLGLVAPAYAVPVLRGRKRVSPGEPLATPTAVAMRASRGVVDLVLGIAGSGDLEAALDAALSEIDRPGLPDAPPASSSSRAVGLVRTGGGSLRAVGPSQRTPFTDGVV
ncbi:MAG TPA: hypothetical protein VKU41_15120 [Polyangiaceae bacterium]|nr:hypothetical protein [Polyangiaceae bacterium]